MQYHSNQAAPERVLALSAELTDAQLLHAWRQGDRRCGNELLRRHRPAIVRFFKARTSADVDDLVQQTILASIAGIRTFRTESTFRGWLHGIARITLLVHLRRRRCDGDAELDSLADGGESPCATLLQTEENARLVEALRRLPSEQQIALDLYYCKAMKGSQIAAALAIPEGTVRQRLRRGLQALRRLLEW